MAAIKFPDGVARAALATLPVQISERKRKGEEQVDDLSQKYLARLGEYGMERVQKENSPSSPDLASSTESSESQESESDEERIYHNGNRDEDGDCFPEMLDFGNVNYELDLVSEGNYGLVLKADRWEAEKEETCALKLAKQGQNYSQLARELKTYAVLKAADVPHTPRILEALEIRYDCNFCKVEKVFLAARMPLYKSGLDEIYHKENPMPFEKATLMYQQLVEVLVHLQRLKLVHRDIKPANIMEDLEGTSYKLGDWGSAEKAGAQNHSEGWTLNYAAPEMLLLNKPGNAVDSWSAWHTFFEMLTTTPLCDAGFSFDMDFNLTILIRLMKDEIGSLPPREWFDPAIAFPEAEDLFTDEEPRRLADDDELPEAYLTWRAHYPLEKGMNWQGRLKAELEKRGVPAAKIEPILDLGRRVVQYKRPLPADYVQHPFFQKIEA